MSQLEQTQFSENQNFDTNASKILIVDDNATNRYILHDHVVELGHIPIMADNGLVGLNQVEKHHPNLILLDILMPTMNGFEMLKRLKDDEEMRHLPVIVISAVDDIQNVVRCIEMGADDYLVKPFNLLMLTARINACLEKKRIHDWEERHREELEKANRIINQQNEELKAANEVINKYMRICSHELRNHLSAVLGYSDLLLAQLEDGEDIGERVVKESLSDIKIIKQAASFMNEIINDALDYQCILNDRVKISLTNFDITPFVKDIIKIYDGLAVKKKIAIKTELQPDLLNVRGDKIRLAQVLGNYITNAIKFSEPNTSITIGIKKMEDMVRVAVQDEGPGIKENERSQLFTEFASLSNKPTGNELSTGLGLTVVKKLIEAQNGTVGANFPKEKGSVFWLELPVEESS